MSARSDNVPLRLLGLVRFSIPLRETYPRDSLQHQKGAVQCAVWPPPCSSDVRWGTRLCRSLPNRLVSRRVCPTLCALSAGRVCAVRYCRSTTEGSTSDSRCVACTSNLRVGVSTCSHHLCSRVHHSVAGDALVTPTTTHSSTNRQQSGTLLSLSSLLTSGS